jgi:hypothetical protein
MHKQEICLMNRPFYMATLARRFRTSVGSLCLGLALGLLLNVLLPASAALGKSGSGSVEWDQEPAKTPAALKLYETRYYKMYTDLEPDAVKEAGLRMDAMAEEYHKRTCGFAGSITQKLPFYLFKNEDDYLKAGGPADTAGVFKCQTLGGKLVPGSGKLLAVAGTKTSDDTWHVVQHEGFHQFVAYVIKGNIPIWADEGLAEYFGEAVFTGDSFISGTLPPERIKDVQDELPAMKDLKDLIQMTDDDWLKNMKTANYDQVWSTVYFLVHADKGKYAKPFCGYINACAGGAKWESAWTQNFGTDVNAAEKQWRKFWAELPLEAGADTRARITVSTLTSFLARAALQKQTFTTAADFFKAAADGQLKCAKTDWLPPALLARGLAEAAQMSAWSIETKPRENPVLVLKTADGKTYRGSFIIVGTKVDKVAVDVKDTKDKDVKPVTAAKPAKTDSPAAAE